MDTATETKDGTPKPPDKVLENYQKADPLPHTSPPPSMTGNTLSEDTATKTKEGTPKSPELFLGSDLSISPSLPRLRFPASMQRLLPFARVSFSSPRHSKQAPYRDQSHAQAFSTPQSSMVYPSTIAPKKRRAPPPPLITDQTQGPECAQLHYTGSRDDLDDCTV